ncbi:SPOR domain-containing protein [Sphingomonas sp. CFBP8993]|uniref:SPOR domain-containing protein n=1 Tax=Sphingomonas sp. CFBP8993 TaxID=3096526 RepID=UPI002A6A1D4D|nr:SPOR domain-containing protein [Sphingomonas sp. CFBP8993]MDY0958372.1 SPOR domain-containing protein [Sphingomonas sp. CFBP8993]
MMRSFPIVGAGMIALAIGLIAAPAFADVNAGTDAWAQGDFRKAVEEWRGPAIAGDPDAQFNLAQAYKLGRGVPLDPALAESWFRKAAIQGHIPASDNYGLALFQSGKKAEAAPWLEKSVAHGEPRAQLVLGTMLFNGDGVPRDYPRAYALMTLASQAGLQSASQTLAQMDQYITPPDREQGTRLVQQYRARLAALPTPVTSGPTRVMVGAEPVRTAAAPASARPRSSVQSVPVVPSRPAMPGYGASYPVPGSVPGTTAATSRPAEPVVEEASDLTGGAQPMRSSPPAHRTAPVRMTTPRPAKPATTPRASGGGWRIQLGAFRDRENATTLWQRVRGRLGGAQPSYVTAGGVTRLQAGGYANRAEAQAACTRSGQPCVVVAP